MTRQSLTADIAKSVNTARDTVSDSLSNGYEAVSTEAGRIEHAVSQSATELANQVSKGIKSVGAEADVMLDAAKDQATALQKLIADEMRVHPMRTLGIVAAVGLLAGYFMKSR